MTRSEVRYARSDGAHVAYRVIEGVEGREHDVVFVKSGTMAMDALFDDLVALRWVEGLAQLGRLVAFDRRGIGLSDALGGSERSSFAGWCDDLEAVVAAAEVRTPVLVSNLIAACVTLLYCDRHPDDVSSLAMFEPAPPDALDARDIRGQIEGEIDSVARLCPSRADEPGFREWFHRAGQLGASPGMAERTYPQEPHESDIGRAAARVRVPVIVLRRPGNALSPPRERDPIMSMVSGAVRVDLPGEDLMRGAVRSTHCWRRSRDSSRGSIARPRPSVCSPRCSPATSWPRRIERRRSAMHAGSACSTVTTRSRARASRDGAAP